MFRQLLIFFGLFFLLCACGQEREENKTNAVSPEMAALSHALDSLGEADVFSGVVAIEKNGKLLLEKSFGYAHLGYQIPNKQSTQFGFASMGKMFTGVAVLQLVEKGKLKLNERIGTYLPEYPNKLVRESVTLHQLLTHTSGLPDFMNEDYLNRSKEQIRELKDYLPFFEGEELEYAPGSRFIYRNSDYVVLGLIIEAISGMSYYDYVEKHILQVAQMENTGFPEWDHPQGETAVGYTASVSQAGQRMANSYLLAARGGPFGGGGGTAKDFLAFARALQNHKLLNPEMTRLAMQGQVDDSTYGYGFVELEVNGHQIQGHSGGHYGVAGELRMFNDLGTNVVVLSNRDPEDGFLEVRYQIERALVGETPSHRRFYFTKKLIKTCQKQGQQAGLALLDQSKIIPKGIMLNRAGFQALDQKDYPLAISLFELYVKAHPTLGDAYDCLGEARRQAGDLSGARESFEKALSLDPGDPYASQKLEEIGS